MYDVKEVDNIFVFGFRTQVCSCVMDPGTRGGDNCLP